MRKSSLPDWSEPELYDTNYFILECYGEDGAAELSANPRLPPRVDNWYMGCRWENGSIPEPLVFTVYEDDEGPLRPYFSTWPLMSDDLVQALRDCGVDNMDCYDAVIRFEESGKEFHNFKAVNVIGTVSGIDAEASNSESLGFGEARFFDSMKFDESKLYGLQLFRLAEAVSNIVVHKKIRDHLIEQGFSQLEFIHPAEFEG